MAYQSVEADERLEHEGETLEFKSFLPGPGGGQNGGGGGTGPRGAAGYYQPPTPGANASFWNLEYYQKYFDVDTITVATRCYTTLLPLSPSYLSAHLTPSPDLYGPFWTLTTLIFCLYVFSSLASSLTAYLSGAEVDYNFSLLSIAVTLVYSYGLGFPVLLWVVLRYFGVSEWSVVEAVAVWGYGQFVWIPVSILCVIPVPIVRWVLVGAGFGVSGYFLVANVYPVIATAEAKAVRGLVVLVAVLHAALALTFKVLFFSYYIKEIGGKDPLGGEVGSDPETTPAIRLLKMFL